MMDRNYAPNQFRGEFSDNFEMELLAQQIFGNKTNRTHESFIRELELEELHDALPAVDISSIPEGQRPQYDEACVIVPEFIQHRLSKLTYPISSEVAAELEDLMMQYHKVTSPGWISIDENFKKTGKTWRYVPELENLHTPFCYQHFE